MTERILKIIRIFFIIVFSFSILALAFLVFNQYQTKWEMNELIALKGQLNQKSVKSTERETGKLESNLPVSQAKDKIYEQGESEQLRDEQGILYTYSGLHNKNNDLAGWIKVEGTNIDYPVMQREKEYYLRRNFKGKYSYSGLPFLDERCDITSIEQNFILYGHNMKNESMFHDLVKYRQQEFAKEHSKLLFDTIYEEGVYDVIAVFDMPLPTDYDQTFSLYEFLDNRDESMVNKFMEVKEKYSLYSNEIEVKVSDRLVILSTCSYHVMDGRLAVVAKKRNG